MGNTCCEEAFAHDDQYPFGKPPYGRTRPAFEPSCAAPGQGFQGPGGGQSTSPSCNSFGRPGGADQFSDWFKSQFPSQEPYRGLGFLGSGEWGSAHAAFGELESTRPDGGSSRRPMQGPWSLADEDALFCPPSPMQSFERLKHGHQDFGRGNMNYQHGPGMFDASSWQSAVRA
eukprot:gnl/TRDRNA2_/TRDRNA2_186748_c0_seq1.p1 gnl/TRDRNA2_/TRDRNA2_186748_c0~~gnl/TRDRNA2_/TRDRNA2_186748_c0_seq1.p1  ORF type:complete len:173 (-),score=16.16 gnl/TRDRNA2_/TRDRNA2_186748_c0_seq1:112-630(-)